LNPDANAAVNADKNPDANADVNPDAPAEFRVETPYFSGTLGELAHALRTARTRPADVGASALVASCLAYYRAASAGNLEHATETLPGLARIIELKLRLLLPQPPKTSEEERDEVLETVLALEAFEAAVGFLRARRETRRHLLPAQAPRPQYPRRARPLSGKLGRLSELATRHRAAHYFELAIERLTLSSAMTRLREGLKRLGRGTLHMLMEARDWPTVTVAFGAMLEMVKEGEVRARQGAAYEAIELEPAPVPERP
jgi:segregation and condensation protein A